MKEEFDKAMAEASQSTVLDPSYRKKKLTLYFIRTAIAIGLIWYFWDESWMLWVLCIYIPLNLIGLFMILGSPYILKKKIEKTGRKIEELDSEIDS